MQKKVFEHAMKKKKKKILNETTLVPTSHLQDIHKLKDPTSKRATQNNTHIDIDIYNTRFNGDN